MAYVPQYVPTNVQALQGTLDQYQRAYDTETARQNQTMDTAAAIPTSGVDTVSKNEIINQFSGKLSELDKKYNYDRANSQYAQELAREITNLRKDPLWAHVQRKDELMKLRDQMKAQRGADYLEEFDPSTIGVKDSAKLNDWKSYDLKDAAMLWAANAKEKATSIVNPTKVTHPAPGYLGLVDRKGYETADEAANYLKNADGQKYIDELIIGAGLEKYVNDPNIRARAFTTAMTQLVGEAETKYVQDPDFVDADTRARKSGKENTGFPGGTTISNIANPNPPPFAISKISDRGDLASSIKTIDDAILKGGPNLEQNLAEKEKREVELAKVDAVSKSVFDTPQGVEAKNTGLNIVKKGLPNLSNKEASDLNDRLMEHMFDTNAYQRSNLKVAMDELHGPFLKTLLKPLGLIGASLSNPGTLGNISSMGKAFENATKEDNYKPGEDSNMDLATNITNEIIIQRAKDGRYGNVDNLTDSSPHLATINKERKRLARQVYKTINEYNDFYKGKAQYNANPLVNIEDEINKRLKAGEVNKFVETSLRTNMNQSDYTDFTNDILSVVHRLVPEKKEYKSGKSGELWDQGKLEAFMKDAKDSGGIDVTTLTNGNDPAMLLLSTKSKQNVIPVSVDDEQSGFDLVNYIYSKTGNEDVMNQFFKGFSLTPNKKYKVDEVINKIPSFVGIKNSKGLEDVSVEESMINNDIVYKLYLSKDDDQPVILANKKDLLKKLAYLQQQLNTSK
jgi:hypothetical protein